MYHHYYKNFIDIKIKNQLADYKISHIKEMIFFTSTNPTN